MGHPTSISLSLIRKLSVCWCFAGLLTALFGFANHHAVKAATAGFTGGRQSSGYMFADCRPVTGSYGVADQDFGRARWGDPQSRCFNDKKTCRVRCFVYCYPSASEVGWAREFPCGEFDCTVFVPCLYHEGVVSAVGICDVPAVMPCSADFASLSCGRAVTSNCRERFIDQCPSTDLSEVCCE